MSNTESKLISAVLKDKQAHVLLQANIDSILRTHGDIWTFIRKYFEVNGSTPPVSLVVEKFRDFIPTEEVAQKVANSFARPGYQEKKGEWRALLRMIDRADPSYKT